MKAASIFTDAESAHWYDLLTKEPKHTVIGANGNERPTTLRDAKKAGTWAPSVTSINKVVAAPQLEKWQATQYLINAFKVAPAPDETPEEWAKHIIELGRAESKLAMAFGTQLHACCEEYNLAIGKGVPEIDFAGADERLLPCYNAYVKWADSEIAEVVAAEIVLTHSVGYAGTCDLLYRDKKGRMVLADIKTKKTEEGKKIVTYQGYKQQLSAYRHAWQGQPIERMGNIYVSTTEPGRLEYIEYAEVEWDKYYMMFKKLLEYWQLDNNYIPRAV
jgi:hypothetical protein